MRLRSLCPVAVRLAAGSLALALVACGGSGSSTTGTGGGTTTPPPTTYTVTVASTNPASGVVITNAPADTTGKSSGITSYTLTYDAGTTVTLVAPQTSAGNTFSQWTGGCSPVPTVADGCVITSLSANTTVTAAYATPVPTYSVTVDSANPASGVPITIGNPNNNVVSMQNTSFTLTESAGATILLTAPATAGSNTFTSWTGCTSVSGMVCTVTAGSASLTATANYTTPPPPAVSLTIDSANPASGVAVGVSATDLNGNGSGATPLALSYAPGTTVTVNAPGTAGGNTFLGWTGCTSVASTACTVALAANTTVTAAYGTAYTLTVASLDPASGATVTASPADLTGKSTGTTPFTLSYGSGTAVSLTASSAIGTSSTFESWTGCTAANAAACMQTVAANATVTANYATNQPTGVTLSPATGSVTIGTTQQFTATVQGAGTFAQTVTWSVAGPSGYTGESIGSISASGLYTTPSPAPATITIKATSTADTTKSASVTLTLAPPAAAAGPALSVDLGTAPCTTGEALSTCAHPISPLIYGANGYDLDTTSLAQANYSIVRWGGDDISRYNFQTNTTNSAQDYYFANFTGAGNMFPLGGDGNFTTFVTSAAAHNAEVVGTVPVNGWISNSNTTLTGSTPACSFPKATYPNQASYIDNTCGNGVDGTTDLYGNNSTPALTSISTPPPQPPAANATAEQAVATSYAGNWVASIVGAYGQGNPASGGGKGVAHWDLDNEPEYWSAVHRDVHPNPMTYDEITNGGIGSALAIKLNDPTALVSGPVISGYYDYFYSQQDIINGYTHGNSSHCYVPWADPTDRMAHGGTPLIEYYLQQFAAAQLTYNTRLLDYVDIHAYYADTSTGANVGLTTAGDTPTQISRMNSTRVFWDPTYTDPNLTQPNYPTDPGYSTSCSPPLLAPQLITTLQGWAAKDYPGTKTSIDEYNFGGLESINGAVTQADVLGIFGRFGLDKGLFWPTTTYSTQIPGNLAFAIYRNYDGNNSTFGDTALNATTANQAQLAVYGASRSSDGAETIVVINKTFGTLNSTLTLPNLTPTGPAATWLYSAASLNAIVAQPAQTLTPPTGTVTSYTLNGSFPGQSITLLVIPTR